MISLKNLDDYLDPSCQLLSWLENEKRQKNVDEDNLIHWFLQFFSRYDHPATCSDGAQFYRLPALLDPMKEQVVTWHKDQRSLLRPLTYVPRDQNLTLDLSAPNPDLVIRVFAYLLDVFFQSYRLRFDCQDCKSRDSVNLVKSLFQIEEFRCQIHLWNTTLFRAFPFLGTLETGPQISWQSLLTRFVSKWISYWLCLLALTDWRSSIRCVFLDLIQEDSRLSHRKLWLLTGRISSWLHSSSSLPRS